MKKYIFEVLEEVSKAPNAYQVGKILKENESWALKDVIRGSMDSTVQWVIPTGEPPYTPCEEHNHPTDLKRQNTKFQYFVEGLHKDQPKFKKERMFLQLLEGIHPKDALVVII